MGQETRFTLRMTSRQNDIVERKCLERNMSKNQFIVNLIEESDETEALSLDQIQQSITSLNESLVYVSNLVKSIIESNAGNRAVMDLKFSNLENDSMRIVTAIENILDDLKNKEK